MSLSKLTFPNDQAHHPSPHPWQPTRDGIAQELAAEELEREKQAQKEEARREKEEGTLP